MAIGTPTNVGSMTFGGGVSTKNVSLVVPSGTLLIVLFTYTGTRSITTVSWNSLTLQQDALSAAQGGRNVAIYSLYVSSGATANLTVTLNGTASAVVEAYTVTGMATTSWFDKQSTNIGGTSSSPTSNATATTTQADELLIGCVANGVGTLGGSWSNSFTDLNQASDATACTLDCGYNIVAATGTYTAAKTGTTSASFEAAIATYKGAAAASSDPPFGIQALPPQYSVPDIVNTF